MNVVEYVQKTFPGLTLRPPLFYLWPIGIRFELGVTEDTDVFSEKYMKHVYHRASTLFTELHAPNDQLLVVTDVHCSPDRKILTKYKLNVYNRYIMDRRILYQLQHQMIPYVFEEDDGQEEMITHRFSLACQVRHINYSLLIKALCNQDAGIKPRIGKRIFSTDLYVINCTKGTILHIYDDRGCDVIATAKESLRSLYEGYHEWILDYDRQTIDQLFQQSFFA